MKLFMNSKQERFIYKSFSELKGGESYERVSELPRASARIKEQFHKGFSPSFQIAKYSLRKNY
jgi:hypothetical protein